MWVGLEPVRVHWLVLVHPRSFQTKIPVSTMLRRPNSLSHVPVFGQAVVGVRYCNRFA